MMFSIISFLKYYLQISSFLPKRNEMQYTGLPFTPLEIALSRTVSELNAFLHFAQKFKMAAKSGRKAIFVESCQ